jgi:DNA-binding MarR family transcriptional regulator
MHSTSYDSGPRWSLLSNHACVLVLIAQDPVVRLRDLATRSGLTERAVTRILSDLEREGLLERRREGRRNTYVLHLDQPLRHPIETRRQVGDLVDLLLGA